MTATIKTKYLGELRTESTHLKSGTSLITDAPIDNKGKGSTFSPTDLFCTSLSSCMLTIMGISAQQHGLDIEGVECLVTKTMASNPRRIGEVTVEFNFPKNNFDEKAKKILQDAAHSCPVALSLHPELKKNLVFRF